MKLEFDSPLDFVDGTAIDATTLATLQYTAYIDTTTPPAKAYPVAASAVAKATKNANGTMHVTVDCVDGDATGFVPVLGTKYYCAISDQVTEAGEPVLGAESPILEYTYEAVPAAVGNFSVDS